MFYISLNEDMENIESMFEFMHNEEMKEIEKDLQRVKAERIARENANKRTKKD